MRIDLDDTRPLENADAKDIADLARSAQLKRMKGEGRMVRFRPVSPSILSAPRFILGVNVHNLYIIP